MAKPKTLPPGSFMLPLAYRIFFLVVEPVAALVGAVYAHFFQAEYLNMTHAASSPALAAGSVVPLGTSVVMSQLANLYLLFTLNEALVLRSTGDMRVWRAVLLVLLIADLGHLYSLRPLGARMYWDVAGWNAIDWGNVPFVYAGASMRIAFLAGVGLGGGGSTSADAGKKSA